MHNDRHYGVLLRTLKKGKSVVNDRGSLLNGIVR